MNDDDIIPEDEKRAFDKRLSEFTGGKVHIEDILKGGERDNKFIGKLVQDVITGIAVYLQQENKTKGALSLSGMGSPFDLTEHLNDYMRIFLYELMRMWCTVNMKMDQDKARRDLGLGPLKED